MGLEAQLPSLSNQRESRLVLRGRVALRGHLSGTPGQWEVAAQMARSAMAACIQADLACEKYKSRDSSRDMYSLRKLDFRAKPGRPQDSGGLNTRGLSGPVNPRLEYWCRPLRTFAKGP